MFKVRNLKNQGLVTNRRIFLRIFVFHNFLFFIGTIIIFLFEKSLLFYDLDNFLNQFCYGYIFPSISEKMRLAFKLNWYLSIFISLFSLFLVILFFLNGVFKRSFDFDNPPPDLYKKMSTIKMIGFIIVFLFFAFTLYNMSFEIYIVQDNSELTVKQFFDNLFYQNIFSITIMLYFNHMLVFLTIYMFVFMIVYLKYRVFDRDNF